MQLIDLPEQLDKKIIRTNINERSCYLFNLHTTAGLTLNEVADPTVQDDILMTAMDGSVARSMER